MQRLTHLLYALAVVIVVQGTILGAVIKSGGPMLLGTFFAIVIALVGYVIELAGRRKQGHEFPKSNLTGAPANRAVRAS